MSINSTNQIHSRLATMRTRQKQNKTKNILRYTLTFICFLFYWFRVGNLINLSQMQNLPNWIWMCQLFYITYFWCLHLQGFVDYRCRTLSVIQINRGACIMDTREYHYQCIPYIYLWFYFILAPIKYCLKPNKLLGSKMISLLYK